MPNHANAESAGGPATAAPVHVDMPGRERPADQTPVAFVQYVADAYIHWSVTEVDAHEVPGAHGPRCLLFARHDCIRRVWDYPADWRTLDDAGLAELSWHR